MTQTLIDDYALLSDCHSAALVSQSGSIDWLCFPRFDSPSIFGRLLDERAGHWSVGPAGPSLVTRRYLPDTLVLETAFETETGRVRVVEALALGPDTGGHRLGRDAPHRLVRQVEGLSGEVEVRVSFSPRPEYGVVAPSLTAVPGGLVTRGGAERLVLTCPVPLRVDGSEASGRATVRRGDVLFLALERRPLGQEGQPVSSQTGLSEELTSTVRQWRRWSSLHQRYEGPWEELVRHSGRVLQALTYHPSGAVVASATTSLPEEVAGERNWDYRFAWVRDASYTMEALWVAACPDEAKDFFSFMTTAASGAVERGEPLQIMFGVGGEHDLSERELSHLAGWRGSGPVRVGNDAWRQQQVDVYGEILSAAYRLKEMLGDSDTQTRAFLAACADAAATRWPEPDQGIWEIRGAPRHFVHSKLMCWVALDRAARMADLLGVSAQQRQEWLTTAGMIREAILSQGWNPTVGAFVQCFDSTDLDASVLMMPMVGFLSPDDPRVVSTVFAVRQGLTDRHGLVHRYDTTAAGDGVAGDEGAFLLCTFWLAHALALIGEVAEARATFERAVGYANDVSLLSEEVDADSGMLLGNMPQAFSHIGLVNAAAAIEEAERAAPDPAFS